MNDQKKFLADGMLGRLARYLRILGYDTAYAGHLEDPRIAAWARYEGRNLLTRDRELTRLTGSLAYLVSHDKIQEQVAEVVRVFSLDCQSCLSRCPVCNRPLIDISRIEARPEVPLYVFREFDQFKKCPACLRLYWKGTHWVHLRETIPGLCQGQELL